VLRVACVIAVAVVGSLACAATVRSADQPADAYTGLFDVVPSKPVAGRSFSLRVVLGNAGPGSTHADIAITVPDGIEVISRSNCTGERELSCPGADLDPNADLSEVLAFAAARPGNYRFMSRLTNLSSPDPNDSNNVATLIVIVADRFTISRATLSPAVPRAGTTFRASVRVTGIAGAAAPVGGASCRAAVAGRPVPARAAIAEGRVVCSVRTPATARGKVLRGTIGVRVGAGRLTRPFGVRLR